MAAGMQATMILPHSRSVLILVTTLPSLRLHGQSLRQ